MDNRYTLSIVLEVVALFATPIILAVEMIYFPDFTAVSSIILAIISVALFMLSFEAKKPSVANLVPTAVFSALGAAGRIAFAPLAYVKPVSAVAIFAGAFLGRHAGFLVGALSALLSNVFFGRCMRGGLLAIWEAFLQLLPQLALHLLNAHPSNKARNPTNFRLSCL